MRESGTNPFFFHPTFCSHTSVPFLFSDSNSISSEKNTYIMCNQIVTSAEIKK